MLDLAHYLDAFERKPRAALSCAALASADPVFIARARPGASHPGRASHLRRGPSAGPRVRTREPRRRAARERSPAGRSRRSACASSHSTPRTALPRRSRVPDSLVHPAAGRRPHLLRRAGGVCLVNADVLAAQITLYATELKMPGLAGAFEEIARDAAKGGHEATSSRLPPAWQPRSSREPSIGWPRASRPPASRRSRPSRPSTSRSCPRSRRARVLDLGVGRLHAGSARTSSASAPRGTGKTHIATAIGLAAIYAGARVRFTTAVTLVPGTARGGR